MDELMAVLHVGESVAVSVLVWRSWVADRERKEILQHMQHTQHWIQSLAMELLKKTAGIDEN